MKHSAVSIEISIFPNGIIKLLISIDIWNLHMAVPVHDTHTLCKKGSKAQKALTSDTPWIMNLQVRKIESRRRHHYGETWPRSSSYSIAIVPNITFILSTDVLQLKIISVFILYAERRLMRETTELWKINLIKLPLLQAMIWEVRVKVKCFDNLRAGWEIEPHPPYYPSVAKSQSL
jgi:hypothetical protein